ncbi:ABC transporter permease subunit [Pseudomonas oryzihabitans]|uniref:ABC transporter permease subunit n=1 Tax=Pseudomonas oryzihabitans TaxID=47885 RepID=UPI0011203117|nr:ABC transporter permease subunit [Pseudomonas psychrotolerans]QDD89174.1 hypothetical protein CCZ28_09150 [Pseudomonas psychrotolerans]
MSSVDIPERASATRLPMKRVGEDRLVRWTLTGVVLAGLLLFLVMPIATILIRSTETPTGTGLANFTNAFASARFWGLIGNSVGMAGLTTVLVIVLAYGYAYGLQRTLVKGKGFLRLVALIPLFAPSLVQGQGLILLFGRNGAINRYLGLDINIYGFHGIVTANLFYAFPYAFLILSAALAIADARPYESARVMGASHWRTFRTVTLPPTLYGLAAACFVCFTLVLTDFGNAMLIGGDFNVLATEMYNQVIGQAQFALGAVIGVVLLIPAMIAKILEKRITRRQTSLIAPQSRPLEPRPDRARDLGFGLYLYGFAAIMLSIVGIVVVTSFVTLWPYNLTPTFKHYAFDFADGITPLWNSILIATLTATLGVIMAGLGAIVVTKFPGPTTPLLSLLAILPSAVPGMVLGLGYVLMLNNPVNPLHVLYGTLLSMVILNVYYNHSQAFLITNTSLTQVGKSYDEASRMLGAGVLRTLRKVTLPILWPTLLGVWVFYFMRAMVSLSALIFLITPSTQIASVAVLQLSDRGAMNQAAAFSVCIMATVGACLLVVRLILLLAGAKDVKLIR